MAYVRKRKSGWQAIWWLPNGSRRSETRIAWTKGAALKYARAREDDHRKHPHLDPDGSEVRVSNLIEGVANRPGKSGKGVAPATREKEAKVFSRIDQAFGDWPVTAVSTEMVIDWVESLVRDFSPGYARDHVGLLERIFRRAILKGLITASPVVGVEIPGRTLQARTAASPEQVAEILDLIDHRYRALVAVLAGTGMRLGEALALMTDDYFSDPPRLTVSKAVGKVEGGGYGLRAPKTTAGLREVSLPTWVAREIDHHRSNNSRDSGLLFPAPHGGLFDPHHFRRRFWKPAAGDVTPHQLRHLQASLLIQNGRPLTEVAARLGHQWIAVTAAVYAHYLGTDDAASANVVPDFRRTATPEVTPGIAPASEAI